MSDTVTADILLTGPIFDGERVGRGYVAIANAQIIAVNLDGAPEPPGLVGTDTRIVVVFNHARAYFAQHVERLA